MDCFRCWTRERSLSNIARTIQHRDCLSLFHSWREHYELAFWLVKKKCSAIAYSIDYITFSFWENETKPISNILLHFFFVSFDFIEICYGDVISNLRTVGLVPMISSSFVAFFFLLFFHISLRTQIKGYLIILSVCNNNANAHETEMSGKFQEQQRYIHLQLSRVKKKKIKKRIIINIKKQINSL